MSGNINLELFFLCLEMNRVLDHDTVTADETSGMDPHFCVNSHLE